jgi:hypothetical protein
VEGWTRTPIPGGPFFVLLPTWLLSVLCVPSARFANGFPRIIHALKSLSAVASEKGGVHSGESAIAARRSVLAAEEEATFFHCSFCSRT